MIAGIIAQQAVAGGGGPPPSDITDFPYTGTEETITVPSGMAFARLKLWGGGGQGGRYGSGTYGGNGGFVDLVIPVTPGDVLTVQTGQGGQWVGATSNNPGGWPDGGTGSYGDTAGGGGGGSSRVFINSDLAAIAGGGGGSAGYSGSGGGGGGLVGSPGWSAGGGTQTAGGVAGGAGAGPGTGPVTYASRNTQRGGNGGPLGISTGADGGGGGGGYYGGGGGDGDGKGAGGGSGYVEPAALAINENTAGGVGSAAAPGSGDSSYPGSPIARGSRASSNADGGDGFVQIELLPAGSTFYSTSDVDAAWGVSGIRGIYSLRKTVPEYPGPLVRGKRTSDNALMDFYPDGSGWIDPAEVATFAGASDVVVERWYNQYPNGLHADNAFGTPPLLAVAGVVPTAGSNPAVMFGGTGFTTKTRLRAGFNIFSTPHTIVFGGKRTNDNAGGGATWGSVIAAALSGGSTISYGYVFSTSVPSMMQNGTTDSSGGTGTTLGAAKIFSWRAAAAFGGVFTVTPYVDKTISSNRTVNFGATALIDGFTSIGAAANGAADHIAGNYSEFVFVPANLSDTDRELIEDTMSAALGY